MCLLLGTAGVGKTLLMKRFEAFSILLTVLRAVTSDTCLEWLRLYARPADKNPYRHGRRADKDSYPHDRNGSYITDDLCSLIKLCFAFIMVNFST